ncbi:hypothetical protein D3C85_1556480 [compost metagenome]
MQPAFLEQQHPQARLAEDFGGDAAARAGADDRHVGVERARRGERGGVQHLPAGRDAGTVNIVDGHEREP